MTPKQFTNAIVATRMDPTGRSAQAARLVLVDGLSRGKAAELIGLDTAAVSRAVSRLLPSRTCPHCDGTGRVADPAPGRRSVPAS